MQSRRAFVRTTVAAALAAGFGAAATGYVRVEQIDGVWWFIGPDGEKFIIHGSVMVMPSAMLLSARKNVPEIS